MNGDPIILTQRAQQQLIVLTALDRGEVHMAEAANLLGLSTRQVRRLRRAYRRHGPKALVHGNRGRRSPRRVDDATRAHIVQFAQTTYAGLNHKHLSELLAERHGLALSHPTIHRILREAGLRSPRRRRPPRHRTRRERMPQAGMLVQCDGSHHAWLEDRGPRLVLHAAIDDATSAVLAGWFEEEETARGYFQVFRQVALGPGLPLAAYSDRHGIFTPARQARWTLEEQLQGQRAPTQVGRMLHELGIQWVPASSPQAKGRIERLFGVLQDRLVAELRLAGVCDQDAANAFLPGFLARYTARFARPAAQPEPTYRPWPLGRDPDTVFCFKSLRTVANDNTVTLNERAIQILPDAHRANYAKARVEVHERLDGTLAVIYQGRRLTTRTLRTPVRAARNPIRARNSVRVHPMPGRSPHPPRTARGHTSTPKPDHPWRQYISPEKLQALKEGRRRTFSLNR